MPAANLYQVVLGASCMEITPEPVANNATTLIPWAHVSGVFPVTIQEKQVSDDTWRYRFNSAVIMHIQISDGNSLNMELQEITNQPTWTGNLAGQKQALSDINASLTPSGGGNFIQATGGTVTDVGDYRYHVLTADDDFIVSYVPTLYNNTINFPLLGGGGGGGGGNGGSGAGAGGLIQQTNYPIAVGLYNIKVGQKGIGSNSPADNATSGTASTFLNFVARGGGYGIDGGGPRSHSGHFGSGGGGTRGLPIGKGITGQGYDGGGSANSGIYGNGGGGGSSEVGQSGTTLINGKGGDGTDIDLLGVTTKVAAGGGAGAESGASTPGLGGDGGGGNGGTASGNNATRYGSGGGGAGGGTNDGGDGYDGIVIIKYPFQNVLNAIVSPVNEYKRYLLPYSSENSRYDQSCVIELQGGTFLMGVDVFEEASGDASPCTINFYTSQNGLDSWTYLSQITSASVSAMIPNLRQKANGDIVCVYLEKTGALLSRLIQRTSTDGGATWGSIQVIRDVALEYLALTSREIYMTSTGRWVVCFEKYDGVTYFTGYTAYSDNEGTSWTIGGSLISYVGTCEESGIVEKPNGDLMRYFRTRSSTLKAVDSSDNAVTWGSIYNTGIAATDSQSTILRLSDDTYKCCYNPSSDGRIKMIIDSSTDLSTWSTVYTIEDTGVNNAIEPYMIQIGTNLSVFYSLSDPTPFNFYDLKQFTIPITEL